MSTSASNTSPTPDQIIGLANEMGYHQRRPEASVTLFFEERSPAYDKSPILINVYYTTRSLMTHLNHSVKGNNELWRSNAYEDLDELKTFFANPRIHTGKGYRNAQKAVRGCVQCGEMKERPQFSNNQWRKGPDANKCLVCCAAGGGAGEEEFLAAGLDNLRIDEDDDNDNKDYPSLTADALNSHNQIKQKRSNNKNSNKPTASSNVNFQGMERRQFNCPDCPTYGRGTFIFFKKVSSIKPICKCPKCKRASGGRCKRLYPVPRDEQRGYGLFQCHQCKDKWGSSRALANVGQECYNCAGRNKVVVVTPFRMEALKPKRKGGGGGGRMRRVPREPIGEDEQEEIAYGEVDNQRFISSVGGGQSYDLQPRDGDNDDYSASTLTSTGEHRTLPVGASTGRIPTGYVHKCAGCATGACARRKVPKSKVHDVSDGNTVSTRASVVTNSSIDKSDFFDRDEDFSGFEDVEDDWSTV